MTTFMPSSSIFNFNKTNQTFIESSLLTTCLITNSLNLVLRIEYFTIFVTSYKPLP